MADEVAGAAEAEDTRQHILAFGTQHAGSVLGAAIFELSHRESVFLENGATEDADQVAGSLSDLETAVSHLGRKADDPTCADRKISAYADAVDQVAADKAEVARVGGVTANDLTATGASLADVMNRFRL